MTHSFFATEPPVQAWPEYTTDAGASWQSFAATEWTAGFLPSLLYLLNQRHTVICPIANPTAQNGSTVDWLALARKWSAGMYEPDNALTSTHGMYPTH